MRTQSLHHELNNYWRIKRGRERIEGARLPLEKIGNELTERSIQKERRAEAKRKERVNKKNKEGQQIGSGGEDGEKLQMTEGTPFWRRSGGKNQGR